ncbi:MAG TPA: hypothetical protein P5077_11170 [bacterium]|nr:hypothetical protein [bacterium]
MGKVEWFHVVPALVLCLVVAVRLPEEMPGEGGTPVKFIEADDLHDRAVTNKKRRLGKK